MAEPVENYAKPELGKAAKTMLAEYDIFRDVSDSEIDEVLKEFVPLYTFADHLAGLKVELYSRQKEGKTFFACSACELVEDNPNLSKELREAIKSGKFPSGPVVFVIDSEGKAWKQYRNWGFGPNDNRKVSINRIFVPDKTMMLKTDPIKSLVKIVRIIIGVSKRYPNGTIVLDSWTDLNRWVRKYIQYHIAQRRRREKQEKDAEDNDEEVVATEPAQDFDTIPLELPDLEVRGDILGFILYLLQNTRLNVILCSRMKRKWKKKEKGKGLERTENWAPARYDETPYFMDVEMRLVKEKNLADGTIERHGYIISNEFEEEIIDEKMLKFTNPSFPALVNRLYPIISERPEDRAKRKKVVNERKKAAKKAAEKKDTEIVEIPEEKKGEE